ncbi:signal recognition particle protein [Histoplasma capsulatum H143]|uniref:Signal recognition particle protein n=1 Tax=Ajellomyces capsulatus (strain H143) TaxID=544712 RepID=C6HN83_AJECH|nr:signal recognition particle protein [Histoplasma capsulatum H143]
MSRHARVEEVSDSDPDDMDPADFDPANLPANSIISPANIPSATTSRLSPQAQTSAPAQSYPPQIDNRDIPRYYQCLYPIYFDKTRSRAEGRKVNKKLAVENPLARDILDAVQVLGLRVGILEPEKLHPKDWANPGRVRVHSPSHRPLQQHHLYIKVAQYLREHPTTEESPFRLRIRGLSVPEKPIPPPAAPRGWKLGTILPFHSPALTGGGVSDNPFKEAMLEMQQQGLGGDMPIMPGSAPEPKKKKEKKKAKA